MYPRHLCGRGRTLLYQLRNDLKHKSQIHVSKPTTTCRQIHTQYYSIFSSNLTRSLPHSVTQGFFTSMCHRFTTQSTSPACKDVYSCTVSDNGRHLHINQQEKNTLSFNATWLRNHCRCDKCIQPHSGQKMIEPSTLKPTYCIQSAQVQGDDLTISLQGDDHMISIPLSFLKDHEYSDTTRNQLYENRTPKVAKGTIPMVEYSNIVKDKKEYLRWLQYINQYGICLVTGVPVEDGMVKKVAELIWPVQQTIYGEVFDVESTPNPINIAYSDSALGFHQDLVYYESAPGLQLLHCMKFSPCVDGGENAFVDLWYIAEEMRKTQPEHFHTLTRVPATFQKIHFDRNDPVSMKFQRPHIELGVNGEIIAVTWAPPFEGPLCVPEEDIDLYYSAHNTLATLIESSDSRLEHRQNPGDLIIFNNKRMLHARKEFKLNGGHRHLQGCYIKIDEFKSRVEVEMKSQGVQGSAARVFNHCLL